MAGGELPPPDALEDYEKYLGEDLSEVYFLDLRAWLRWKHREIWNEADTSVER